MPALEVRGLKRVLEDRDRRFELHVDGIEIERGGRLAVVGPSGSGKTTLFDMLALATPPDACTLFRLGPEDLTSQALSGSPETLAALRRTHFGYVLQSANLIPFLTVEENVLLTQRIAQRGEPAYARELLQHLGIRALRAMPGDLSAGQRHRVAIARAFAHLPSVILCDEPTAALDPVTARDTLRLCVLVAEAVKAGLAIVTHDPALASDLGFRFIAMRTERTGNTVVARLSSEEGGQA